MSNTIPYGSFAASASDLGLGVGRWPNPLRVCLDADRVYYQNGVERDRDGDVTAVRYLRDDGKVILTVYND